MKSMKRSFLAMSLAVMALSVGVAMAATVRDGPSVHKADTYMVSSQPVVAAEAVDVAQVSASAAGDARAVKIASASTQRAALVLRPLEPSIRANSRMPGGAVVAAHDLTEPLTIGIHAEQGAEGRSWTNRASA